MKRWVEIIAVKVNSVLLLAFADICYKINYLYSNGSPVSVSTADPINLSLVLDITEGHLNEGNTEQSVDLQSCGTALSCEWQKENTLHLLGLSLVF